MSSYVQHFSDGSHWGCLDDYFGHHEYGYIKLKDETEWYKLGDKREWKHRVVTGEDFQRCTKGLDSLTYTNSKIVISYNGKTYIPGRGNILSMENIIKNAISDSNLQEKAEEPHEVLTEKRLVEEKNVYASDINVGQTERADWHPSPGEEIEVSNDKKTWHRKTLEKFEPGEDYPFVTVPDEGVEDYDDDVWNYARPLRPLVQLPELSEFDWLKQCRKSFVG